VIALAAIVGLALLIQQSASIRMALLFATGTALGIVLYQSLFGFTSAFRVLLADGRSAGFRAQMVMLGVACLLFFPALGAGSLWGHPVVGYVSPVGVSVAVGSFLFGVGMQLGGGCASGTLFSVGGGSTKMVLTLLFFIVGSVVGVVQLAWWQTLPSFAPISLVAVFGWPLALLLNIGVFAAAYALVAVIERKRHGTVEPMATIENGSWLRGPWPLLAGALGLAILNFGADMVRLLGPGHAEGAGGRRAGRHHLGHGRRHHDRRDAVRRACQQVQAGVAHLGPAFHGVDDRWIPARLRRPPGLWLQHRRLLQRHRVGKRSWLGLDRLRPDRQLGCALRAAGLRSARPAPRRGMLRATPWA
jgi:uncharacterized membrane protein YedE/YeeE